MSNIDYIDYDQAYFCMRCRTVFAGRVCHGCNVNFGDTSRFKISWMNDHINNEEEHVMKNNEQSWLSWWTMMTFIWIVFCGLIALMAGVGAWIFKGVFFLMGLEFDV